MAAHHANADHGDFDLIVLGQGVLLFVKVIRWKTRTNKITGKAVTLDLMDNTL
jgi:hypothetical protein